MYLLYGLFTSEIEPHVAKDGVILKENKARSTSTENFF